MTENEAKKEKEDVKNPPKVRLIFYSLSFLVGRRGKG